MKRGADRQITKDDDDQEIEEVSDGSNFAKADDAILATRKIKGMPRSRIAGSPSPFSASSSDSNGAAETPATPPASKFSSFSGFGAPASSGNPFSFTPPASSPSFPPPPTTNSFGTTPGTPTPSGLFSSGTPAVAPTASNAAKTFASFLGDSSSKPTGNDSAPPPPPQSNAPDSTSESDTGDEAALKYYTSLRGLNVSILAAITKAIDQDPFVDVASLLDRYNTLRLDVQKEFDDRSNPQVARSSAPSPSPSPFGAPPSAPLPAAAPSAPPKMPAPPTAFAGFGGFGNKPAAAAAPPPKTNGATDATPAPPSNPFSFASSSSTSKSSIFAPPATSPFGASSSSSSPFGSAPPTSMFGSGASTTSSPFGTAASPSPFGAAKPSLFSGGSSGAFGSSSSSSTPFSFAGSGSIGNPVGFTFGSPKGGETSKEEKKSDGAAKTEGEGKAEAEEEAAEGGASQETDKGPDDSTPGTSQEGTSTALLFGSDAATGMDAEGEGEEDEETVHSARIKAFRMQKKEGGGSGGWLDIGIGMLRLKKHKETSARRLLLRNSHSGKIQINFALYPGLKASQSKKSLTFVGHDETSEAQTYSMRFRSEEVAKEFNVFLEQEVAKVKSS
ncbi:hypothetical protein DFH07DRAFT_1057456 [Mycena maculata]|uniref:RanBD1 domain-containing protein n=1 Tax=Mycena maculata TaxID=230809 RepID=A0AAD7JVR3_9AGAR|nr:hypothetical protein DFH07DRAFT_1057456 [Mycena maculata]